MAGEEGTAQSSFPPPPSCYYSSYTDEAVSNGTAPPPPPVPTGSYSCFGAPLEVNEEILRPLSSQGIQQLYPNEGGDRISEMRKLNFSILVNFLDLLDILIQAPNSAKREEKVNDISLLFINLHHLINEYRPHQARETIRVMMTKQRDQRQTAITAMQGHLDKARELLDRCTPFLAQLKEGSGDVAAATATLGQVLASQMSAAGVAAGSGVRRPDEEPAGEAMDVVEPSATSSSSSLEPHSKRPYV